MIFFPKELALFLKLHVFILMQKNRQTDRRERSDRQTDRRERSDRQTKEIEIRQKDKREREIRQAREGEIRTLNAGLISLKSDASIISRGQLSIFIFFVPYVLKIISRQKSFFKYRGMGHIKPPLWSLFFNPSLKNLV